MITAKATRKSWKKKHNDYVVFRLRTPKDKFEDKFQLKSLPICPLPSSTDDGNDIFVIYGHPKPYQGEWEAKLKIKQVRNIRMVLSITVLESL